MSYILDALNKAERERGGKRMPAPLAEHDSQAVRGSRLWIVTGALVVCLSVVIWFFLRAHSTIPRTSAPAGAGAAQETTTGRAGVETSGEAAHANTEPLPSPSPELSAPGQPARSKDDSVSTDVRPSTASIPAPVQETAGGRQGSSAGKNAAVVRRPGPSTPSMTVPQPNAPEPQVLPPSDEVSPQAQPSAVADGGATGEALPKSGGEENKAVSLQEALDKMTISVLMYAESKSDRRVYINGRKYVEGDYVGGRYLVESITLEGVVLSYEGQRALLRSGSK